MGTNYYWTHISNKCSCCGRADKETKHIGKSSAGWVFGLHVYPEEGIHDLPDWKRLLEQPDTIIEDEYGDVHSAESMLRCITERSWPHAKHLTPTHLSQNHAVVGPSNLLRAELNPQWCIKHGEGTWDCRIGEFS